MADDSGIGLGFILGVVCVLVAILVLTMFTNMELISTETLDRICDDRFEDYTYHTIENGNIICKPSTPVDTCTDTVCRRDIE